MPTCIVNVPPSVLVAMCISSGLSWAIFWSVSSKYLSFSRASLALEINSRTNTYENVSRDTDHYKNENIQCYTFLNVKLEMFMYIQISQICWGQMISKIFMHYFFMNIVQICENCMLQEYWFTLKCHFFLIWTHLWFYSTVFQDLILTLSAWPL